MRKKIDSEVIKEMKGALFIPCEKRKLAKVSSVNADVIIFDLEDSVREEDKEKALGILVELLKTYENKSNFMVRVNQSKDFMEMDALYQIGIRRFMLPKSENSSYINEIALRYKDIRLCLLIETPMGLLNIEQMCQVKGVEELAFGAEDFCAQMGMINRADLLLPIKEKVAITAKAYAKMAFDTITLEIHDDNIIKEKIIESMELGFDGKLFIHPKQLNVLESINSNDDYEELKKIVKIYDNSFDGVLVYNDKVYEKPHIEHMRRIINDAKQ